MKWWYVKFVLQTFEHSQNGSHPTAPHKQKENRMSSEHWTGHAQSGPCSALVISIRRCEKYSGTHICPICRQVQNRQDITERQWLEICSYPKKELSYICHVICGSFLIKERKLFFLPPSSGAEPSVSLSMHIPSACDAHTAATAQVYQCFVIHNARLFTISCEQRQAPAFTSQKDWFGWGPKSQTEINL